MANFGNCRTHVGSDQNKTQNQKKENPEKMVDRAKFKGTTKNFGEAEQKQQT
jgi:hypothetical protein